MPKLADFLTRHWYTPGKNLIGLSPLKGLYASVVRLRRYLYSQGILQKQTLPVPVIICGNITVGGTGKTPLVMCLVEHLVAQGWSPGVVSRGYGGRQQGVHVLPETPDPLLFGDEPCLIKQGTGVPVATGSRRPEAARLLLEQGVDVIISDDGLQHYRLVRDLELCVIDRERLLGNRHMLPCGPLREPPSRLEEVDFCIVNGGNNAIDGGIPMTLRHTGVRHVQRQQWKAIKDFEGQPVHAIAGIGNPDRFFDSLRAHHLDIVDTRAFPDHHTFSAKDMQFDRALPLFMTTKDAIKCRTFAQDNMWQVEVKADLPPTFFTQLDRRLHLAQQEKKDVTR